MAPILTASDRPREWLDRSAKEPSRDTVYNLVMSSTETTTEAPPGSIERVPFIASMRGTNPDEVGATEYSVLYDG